VTILT